VAAPASPPFSLPLHDSRRGTHGLHFIEPYLQPVARRPAPPYGRAAAPHHGSSVSASGDPTPQPLRLGQRVPHRLLVFARRDPLPLHNDAAVLWTSLGPILRWVLEPTTRWAPRTTQLMLHGTCCREAQGLQRNSTRLGSCTCLDPCKVLLSVHDQYSPLKPTCNPASRAI
jgi:hypothetical protein